MGSAEDKIRRVLLNTVETILDANESAERETDVCKKVGLQKRQTWSTSRPDEVSSLHTEVPGPSNTQSPNDRNYRWLKDSP